MLLGMCCRKIHASNVVKLAAVTEYTICGSSLLFRVRGEGAGKEKGSQPPPKQLGG